MKFCISSGFFGSATVTMHLLWSSFVAVWKLIVFYVVLAQLCPFSSTYHVIVASAILIGDIRDLALHLLLEETQDRPSRVCVYRSFGRCLDIGCSSHVRFCFFGRHAAACSSKVVTKTRVQLATVCCLVRMTAGGGSDDVDGLIRANPLLILIVIGRAACGWIAHFSWGLILH